MRELTWPLGLMIGAILIVVGFVLCAPTGHLARVINAVGNAIQKALRWIGDRFS